jgi:hypothetical protein
VAKKSRTPPPPRKVQAPKTRTDPKKPTDRRRYLVAIGAGVAGLIALAVVLAVVLASGGGGSSTASVGETMRAAGCSFTTVPSQPYPPGGSLHIQNITDKVTYDTYPPSNGYHFPTPAIWSNYSQAVNPKRVVHNEEHGAVVVWYGPKTSAEDRQKIDEFYNESPNGMVVTPIENTAQGVTYPKHQPLGSKIALTAWVAPKGTGQGVLAICPSVNMKAFQTFRDAFRGKGPESYLIPTSSETPGS